MIVIHFGGSATNIDAYTFANALVSFADAVQSINDILNPGEAIVLRLTAQGPGSYRAVVKKVRQGLGGVFSRGLEPVFWGVVATLIYEKVIKNDPPAHITVTTNEVIIQNGNDRVIVPRIAYEALPNVRNDPKVQSNLSRTFKILERDAGITAFGVTSSLSDPEPVVLVPRAKFEMLAEPVTVIEGPQKTREREDKARLVILKAWLNHAKRKWSFEWNGVPLSAPIADNIFLDKLDQREYLIGSGDALDVILKYTQNFDEELGVYVNDPNSFVISEVIKPVPRNPTKRLAAQ